ncbi:MAG: LysR substrate-binding domain-containing protein [Bacillota bacterium]
MRIEYLKYFNEVAATRSISKVANNFHISQPALSQQIQKLEEMLGHKLLIRSNKGVELTEAGHIVEKYARNLIKAYDNMLEDLEEVSKNHSTIRIDSVLTLGTYALPCTLYNVKEKYPEISFSLTTNTCEDVERNVLNGVCDIGFIYGRPEEKTLHYTKVGVDKLVVIATEDYPIQQDINLKELLTHRLIMLQEKFRQRKELNSYLRNLGYSIDGCNVFLCLDSTESVKSAVIKGYGLSIVPYISVKKELYTKQLKQIQIVDFDMSYDIYLIYRKDKYTSSNVKNFINYLKQIGEKSFC